MSTFPKKDQAGVKMNETGKARERKDMAEDRLCGRAVCDRVVCVRVYHLNRCKTHPWCRGGLGNMAVTGQ